MLRPTHRTALAALTAGVVLLLGNDPALAAGAAAGAVGHDLSYPNCGAFPPGRDFAIVGVTGNNQDGGRVYSTNPCLAEQAAWAKGLPSDPALYINTANAGSKSVNWPSNSGKKPVPCANDSTSDDVGCAYGYGWNAAADAFVRAQAITAFDPRTVTWWLDVESANTWAGDRFANTASIQGFADHLRSQGIPSVGIYSVPSAWSAITGAFTASNAASYRAAWSSAFAPQHPIELGPVWLAGVGDVTTASGKCGTATLTGSAPLLVQYLDDAGTPDYDGDYQCAAESTDASPPTAVLGAPNLTTTLGNLVPTWSGSDDRGVSSYDVRYRRAPYTAAAGAPTYPAAWQVTRFRSAALAPAAGSTYCFSVRSRDARANLSAWSGEKCSAAPIDDRSLLASAGWTRPTSSAFYRGTATTTTRLGATLTRSGVQAKRLALVATRCPSCGKVEVRLGSTLLQTVDLRGLSTTHKHVFPLKAFTLRATTVTLKVVSSGKTVQVDGLTASRF